MSSWIVKERIGLPIWDGDFVVGIKHFFPGQEIATTDFEEARQDEDQQSELVSYNTYTPEEYAAKTRLDQISDELKPLQAGADSILKIDYENLSMSVDEEDQDRFDEVQMEIKSLEDEKRKLEEGLS